MSYIHIKNADLIFHVQREHGSINSLQIGAFTPSITSIYALAMEKDWLLWGTTVQEKVPS